VEKDWTSIKMIHKSVKEKDPLKVGRFGLGFKSVFHLTGKMKSFSCYNFDT
jgi:sacsin